MGLPLIKALGLIVKTVSKPFGKWLALQAKENPKFKRLCSFIAQTFHRIEQVLEKPGDIKMKNVRPLNEEIAVQFGCEIVSESVVFGLGLGVVWIEYNRSSEKEAAKEAARKAEMTEVQKEIISLKSQFDTFKSSQPQSLIVNTIPPVKSL